MTVSQVISSTEHSQPKEDSRGSCSITHPRLRSRMDVLYKNYDRRSVSCCLECLIFTSFRLASNNEGQETRVACDSEAE